MENPFINEAKIDRRMFDGYEEEFREGRESDLFQSVRDMEANSEWIPGIISKDIHLAALESRPMFLSEDLEEYKFRSDEEIALVEDTISENGTKLVIYTGGKYHPSGRCYELVRDTAMPGLSNVAKLNGSALGRMPRSLYAETMNNAFSVATGCSLGLIRYGKLSGLHSGADGGYMVMPISKLMNISLDAVTKKFKGTEFVDGYNSHSYTQARWSLPYAQSQLLDLYQKAIEKAGIESQYALNFMPGIDFHSSDTAGSCATLDPIFFHETTAIHFCDGVRIKHLRRGNAKDKDGLELFAEGADDIFAKFQDTAKLIGQLASKKIYHAENCVVKLCKKYGIAPKYGTAAYDEVERIAMGENYISAHDLYLAMYEALAEAERSEASRLTLGQIEESLMKIARITDFSEYDVSGVVSWKD